MDGWHATFRGRRHLPREATALEVEVPFQVSAKDTRIIEGRRRPEIKVGLTLQIDFMRMSGRLLDAVRIVPPLRRRHLGARFGVAAPDLTSLRELPSGTDIDRAPAGRTRRARVSVLTARHGRALVGTLRDEFTRTDDRERVLGFARRWLHDHRLLIVHERRLRAMTAAARRQHAAELARRTDQAVEPCLLIWWHAAMQAVADALSLLANVRVAWNTAQMQPVLDHWAQRRGGTVPAGLIGCVAPTRTGGIRLRGMLRFPVERCANKILPSVGAGKTMVAAS